MDFFFRTWYFCEHIKVDIKDGRIYEFMNFYIYFFLLFIYFYFGFRIV